jgi:RNA polymerase sigma-70 factor (ECF subfamily)
VDLVQDATKLQKDFDQLYTVLWPEVYRFIYYKVQNRQEAEELTQEIFHRVYRHVIKNNIEEGKLRAYIFACARNIVYDAWRDKHKHMNIIELDEVSEKDALLPDQVSQVEGNLMVREVLELLNAEEREIITLRIIKGYSISYVSDKLGRPEGTIKSIQFRALQKLRKGLEKGGYFNDR